VVSISFHWYLLLSPAVHQKSASHGPFVCPRWGLPLTSMFIVAGEIVPVKSSTMSEILGAADKAIAGIRFRIEPPRDPASAGLFVWGVTSALG